METTTKRVLLTCERLAASGWNNLNSLVRYAVCVQTVQRFSVVSCSFFLVVSPVFPGFIANFLLCGLCLIQIKIDWLTDWSKNCYKLKARAKKKSKSHSRTVVYRKCCYRIDYANHWRIGPNPSTDLRQVWHRWLSRRCLHLRKISSRFLTIPLPWRRFALSACSEFLYFSTFRIFQFVRATDQDSAEWWRRSAGSGKSCQPPRV